MKPHGGVGFGVGRHQRAQRQPFGSEDRHVGDLYTTLPGGDDGETAGVHIGSKGDRPEPKETEMTNTENKLNGSRRKSLTTMMAALLAGSLVATAGSFAYAKTDGQAFDPAKFQQRIETRVDKALTGTDATADQKKQVGGHPGRRLQGHEAAA